MKYNVIYCDPPYTYRNIKTGGSMKSGALNFYPTITNKDLKLLPISNICEKDCIMFLWVTVPLIDEGMELLKSWGFKYKTMLTWRKVMSLGLGYHFRGQTEHILVGMKGKIKALRCQVENIYQCRALKHSEKPEYFRGLIEMATENIPSRKMVELFSRKTNIPCWKTTGLDSDGIDIRDFLKGEVSDKG